jgi:DNA polymerase III epsilon subunit-like protein
VRARRERVTAEAAAISGYDAAVWKAEAVPLHEALAELVEMRPRGKTVVPAGQNVRMDVLFLERAFKACEIPYPFDYHVVDLVTLYYSWSLIAGETLSALSLRNSATAAGLATGTVPHRALGDARLTLETFRHYLGRLAPRRRSEEEAEAPLAAPEKLET